MSPDLYAFLFFVCWAVISFGIAFYLACARDKFKESPPHPWSLLRTALRKPLVWLPVLAMLGWMAFTTLDNVNQAASIRKYALVQLTTLGLCSIASMGLIILWRWMSHRRSHQNSHDTLQPLE